MAVMVRLAGRGLTQPMESLISSAVFAPMITPKRLRTYLMITSSNCVPATLMDEEIATPFIVITPMSQHFCESCNRIRLTVDGTLLLCLGQEARVDLGTMLRAGASDAELIAAIRAGIARKPERHEFRESPGKIVRFMAQTGG